MFFCSVDSALGQCSKQRKLKFVKMRFWIHVFSSKKTQKNLILPLSNQSHLYCNILDRFFLTLSFFKFYLPWMAQNFFHARIQRLQSSPLRFVLKLRLIVFHPAVWTHENLFPRWILGYKITCSYASEVFPGKHERAD